MSSVGQKKEEKIEDVIKALKTIRNYCVKQQERGCQGCGIDDLCATEFEWKPAYWLFDEIEE